MNKGLYRKIAKGIVRKCLLAMSVMMLCVAFAGCGKSSPEGYYIYEGHDCVMVVSGDSFTYYKNKYNSSNWWEYSGTIKKNDDDSWNFYITKDDANESWAKFSPMKATQLNDGKTLYLESNGAGWIPDGFTKVSKSEYEDYRKKLETPRIGTAPAN